MIIPLRVRRAIRQIRRLLSPAYTSPNVKRPITLRGCRMTAPRDLPIPQGWASLWDRILNFQVSRAGRTRSAEVENTRCRVTWLPGAGAALEWQHSVSPVSAQWQPSGSPVAAQCQPSGSPVAAQCHDIMKWCGYCIERTVYVGSFSRYSPTLLGKAMAFIWSAGILIKCKKNVRSIDSRSTNNLKEPRVMLYPSANTFAPAMTDKKNRSMILLHWNFSSLSLFLSRARIFIRSEVFFFFFLSTLFPLQWDAVNVFSQQQSLSMLFPSAMRCSERFFAGTMTRWWRYFAVVHMELDIFVIWTVPAWFFPVEMRWPWSGAPSPLPNVSATLLTSAKEGFCFRFFKECATAVTVVGLLAFVCLLVICDIFTASRTLLISPDKSLSRATTATRFARSTSHYNRSLTAVTGNKISPKTNAFHYSLAIHVFTNLDQFQFSIKF